MKKLMFVAVVALSTAAFAHEDVSAKADGFYDVTLTTKSLAHAEKTVSKTFKTKKNGGTAYQQLMAHLGTVTNKAGFTVLAGGAYLEDEDAKNASPIAITYSYFDTDKDGKMKTKVVSKANNGLYDAKTGKVYLWDKSEKVDVQYDKDNADLLIASKQKKGVEQIQSGFKAYEVPLAMHKQFIATDDGKAAGGFTGGTAVATDGTALDFAGLTAFGTGTIDKDDNLKTVAGNVAAKSDDVKFGCYGTWKLNLDSKSAKYKTVKDALLAKKCVELVNERD